MGKGRSLYGEGVGRVQTEDGLFLFSCCETLRCGWQWNRQRHLIVGVCVIWGEFNVRGGAQAREEDLLPVCVPCPSPGCAGEWQR